MTDFASRVKMFLDREWYWTVSITGRRLVVISLMALLLLYMTWSAYWLVNQGFWAIRWHTHIVFTFMLTAVLLLPILLSALLLPHKSAEIKRLVLNVIVAVTLLEVILLVTGLNKTYMEQRAGVYQSPYDQNMGNYYNVRFPHDTLLLKSPEFTFPRTVNSLGHSDKEWNRSKDSPVIRILTLGDSFTEGDGAPVDSTYPKLMESILRKKGHNVEVLNAGVAGSDPFFGYRNLKDRLLAFDADVVVQTIYSDDMLFDIPLRGGMERFVDDTVIRLRKGPWWEPIAAVSYSFRGILAILGKDISEPNGGVSNAANVAKVGLMVKELMAVQDTLSCQNNFITLWAVMPLKHELRDGKFVYPYYEHDLASWAGHCGHAVVTLPCYSQYLDSMGLEPSDLFWIQDGHHNSKGYLAMAHCLADEIDRLLVHKPSLNPTAP
jgi:hypothetical protein